MRVIPHVGRGQTTMLRAFFVLVLILISTMTVSASAQTFGNESVIALHNAGLGEGTIITKINSLPCGYDVSTDALIALKRSGLSDRVMASMVDRCTSSVRAQGTDSASADVTIKRTPGIYLSQDWLAPKKLLMIRPIVSGGTRTTGIGSIVFPMKSMLVIPQDRSQNLAQSRRPVFFFYFDVADRNVSDFGTERSRAAQSPTEFSLIKFKLKNNSREIEVGRMSTYYVTNVQKGVKAKDVYSFVPEEIGDGIFKVEPLADMLPGEYAFIFSGESGRSRVYDFSVVAQPVAAASR